MAKKTPKQKESAKQKEYRVVWEIDVSAKNPRDAAKQAQDLMRDKNAFPWAFIVIPFNQVDRVKGLILDKAVKVDMGA